MKLRGKKILIILACIFSLLAVSALTSCVTINTNITQEETYLLEKILARRVGHLIGTNYPGEAVYLKSAVETAKKGISDAVYTTEAQEVLSSFTKELMQDSFKLDPLLASDVTDIVQVFVTIDLPEGEEGILVELTEEQKTHILVILGGIEDGLAIAEAELLIKE